MFPSLFTFVYLGLPTVLSSDGSGKEKVGFGWVREFPKFENPGSGISGLKKVGFGRELKSWVSSSNRPKLRF